MMGKVKLLVTVMLAFSAGWMARSLTTEAPRQVIVTQAPPVQAPSPASTVMQEQADTVVQFDFPEYQAPAAPEEQEEQEKPGNLLGKFQQLLAEGKPSEAIQLLSERSPYLSRQQQQQWRSAFTRYLSSWLNDGQTELFLEAVHSWLQINYEDVDVLLMLADYYRMMNYHSEALQTFIQAGSYTDSYNIARVNEKLLNYIQSHDAALSDKGEWYDLLLFYEQLDRLDISNPAQSFRYAELLLMHSDEGTADVILDELLSTPGWDARVAQLRRAYSEKGEYQASRSTAPGYQSSVAMQAIGHHHYLLDIGLNGAEHRPRLLLDTGASITMLTENAFARLAGDRGWKDLGWRLFNTANGISRGRLMQVDELQLGQYVLKDVKVSVQGADLGGEGVEGLLGMNVLSRFHFKIDQDQNKLMLTPRG